MTDFIADIDATNETLMLHELARATGVAFDRRAHHLKLTRAQWKLLSTLRRNPGIRQALVAEMLEIEPITLVRQLDRMEKTGWVERRPDPHDRRANQLFLTDKVAGIVHEMRDIALKLRSDALKGFSADEHKALVKALVLMKSNVAVILAEEDE